MKKIKTVTVYENQVVIFADSENGHHTICLDAEIVWEIAECRYIQELQAAAKAKSKT